MLVDFAQRFVCLVLEEFSSAFDLGKQVIEPWNDDDSEHRSNEHAADGGGADRSVSNRSRAGGANQRNKPRNEGE